MKKTAMMIAGICFLLIVAVSGMVGIGYGAYGLFKVFSGRLPTHTAFATFFYALALIGGCLAWIPVKQKVAFVVKTRSWWGPDDEL